MTGVQLELALWTKHCARGNHDRPIDQFARDRTRPDGRFPTCRDCMASRPLTGSQRARYAEQRAYRRRMLKAAVMAWYGESCACCAASDRDELSIDHLDGDGKAHRNAIFGRQDGGWAFYRWLIDNDFPDGFVTLCRRCNRSKGTRVACRLNHTLAA